MTIQKLIPQQNDISGFVFKAHSDLSSRIPPLSFHRQKQIAPSHFSSRNWCTWHWARFSDVRIVMASCQIFMRQFETLGSSVSKFKKNLEYGRFSEKIAKKQDEGCQDHFKRLVTDGDMALHYGCLNDAEKFYAWALKTISQKDDFYEAACSKKLAALYLKRANSTGHFEDKKDDCLKAAGLFQYALHLARNLMNEALQNQIQEDLMRVDFILCSLCGIQNMSEVGAIWDIQNEQKLKNIRKNFQIKLSSSFDGPEEIKNLFQEVTAEMKRFTVSLIDQAKKILGDPPLDCDYAVIGFGSMAREEMTPFSDLEFAILIEEGKDTEEVKQYFRNLIHFMHLRVLNLGETIVPILGIEFLEGFYDKVTLKGFAFDGKSSLKKGHKTPLGKRAVFELIRTPKKMASFQGKDSNQYWYEKEPFLPTELHNVNCIYGDESLLKSYLKELDGALREKSKDGSSLRDYYSKKHLLIEDLAAFESNFGDTEEGMLFELKKDLYRLPHLFVERLFLGECENFSEQGSLLGTFSKIDWLMKKNCLCKEGSENLKKAFGKILLSRLKNCYMTNSAKSVNDPILKPSAEIDESVCNTNYSFYQALKRKFEAGECLRNNVFYSYDPYLLAQIKARFEKYKEAYSHILLHLESHPSHLDGLILAARVSDKLGLEQTSRNNLGKAFEIIETFEGNTSVKVVYLAKLGSCYLDIEDLEKAAYLLEKAQSFIEMNPELASLQSFVSSSLSMIYSQNNEFKKAKDIIEVSLLTLKNKSSMLNSRWREGRLALCLNSLSIVFYQQKIINVSIKYAEESLARFSEIYGKRHIVIGTVLTNLGNCYVAQGSFSKGVDYLKEGLAITMERLGRFHRDSLRRYLGLFRTLEEADCLWDIARDSYFEGASSVEVNQISIFRIVGLIWYKKGWIGKAEKIFLNAIKIALDQKLSIDLAIFYEELADLLLECGRKSESLHYMELALDENKKIFSSDFGERIALNHLKLATIKISQITDNPRSDSNLKRESIVQDLQEAERIIMEISETGSANELLVFMHLCLHSLECVIAKNFNEAADYFKIVKRNGVFIMR